MLSGNIMRFADKQALLILFDQCQLLKNKYHKIRPRSPSLTFQSHFTSILTNILTKQNDWGPFTEVKQFLKENASGKHIAISTLTDILQVDKTTAKSILLQHSVFTEMPKKKIIYNYRLLRNSGAYDHLIQENVSLLTEDSNVLEKKIQIVKNFIDDINICIPFLYRSISELNLFVKSRMVKNNDNSTKYVIDYYQEELQIDRKDVYNIVSKNLTCVIHDPKETIKKIKLLLDCKITVDQLIDNNWPMYCNYQYMKDRLVQYSELEMLQPIQPYILNCPETVFVRKLKTNYLQKKAKENRTKEKNQIVEHLVNKSGYSKEVIKRKIYSLPQQSFPTLSNFTRRVEIILNEGYDYHDVVWSIKVISLPEDFITNRFSALRAIDHKAPYLNVLLLSDENFSKYLNKQNNENLS